MRQRQDHAELGQLRGLEEKLAQGQPALRAARHRADRRRWHQEGQQQNAVDRIRDAGQQPIVNAPRPNSRISPTTRKPACRQGHEASTSLPASALAIIRTPKTLSTEHQAPARPNRNAARRVRLMTATDSSRSRLSASGGHRRGDGRAFAAVGDEDRHDDLRVHVGRKGGEPGVGGQVALVIAVRLAVLVVSRGRTRRCRFCRPR